MIRADLHLHTTYSDGQNTPAEMAEAALSRGFLRLGFSDHGYTAHDESYCMSKEGEAAYRREIAALKTEYAGRLEILCGIEQDYYGGIPSAEYDYVIGSVHYLKLGAEYIPVDESEAILRDAIARRFGGDPLALAEAYFETVSDVLNQTGADIVGHLDLVAKFNAGGLFDETAPRYRAAWRHAIDALLPAGKPFEINTGAIARGYQTRPYPSLEMIAYIKERGGRLLLSSDAHTAAGIGYAFNEWEPLLA